jgi:hypothetical protein
MMQHILLWGGGLHDKEYCAVILCWERTVVITGDFTTPIASLTI